MAEDGILKAWVLARFLDRNMGDNKIVVEIGGGQFVNITDARTLNGKIVLIPEHELDLPNIILEPVDDDGSDLSFSAAIKEALRKEDEMTDTDKDRAREPVKFSDKSTLGKRLCPIVTQVENLHDALLESLKQEIALSVEGDPIGYAKALAGEDNLNDDMEVRDLSRIYLQAVDLMNELYKLVKEN